MRIIKLNAIDSTNTYLKQLAKEMLLPNDTVVVAENQLAGRGQWAMGGIPKRAKALHSVCFKLMKGCWLKVNL